MTRIIPEPLLSALFRKFLNCLSRLTFKAIRWTSNRKADFEWWSPVTGIPHSLDSVAKARDTLDHLRGNRYSDGSNGSYYGEENCIVNERLSAVAAEIRRIDLEIEELQNQVAGGEQSIGRISDADMAREATHLAKSSLKMSLAE